MNTGTEKKWDTVKWVFPGEITVSVVLQVPHAAWTKYLVSQKFGNTKHRRTCTLTLNPRPFCLLFVSWGIFFLVLQFSE